MTINIERGLAQQHWFTMPIDRRAEWLARRWEIFFESTSWFTEVVHLDANQYSNEVLMSALATQREAIVALFSEHQILRGITGEQNELYCTGKGLGLLHISAQTSVVAVLLALQGAWMSGNSLSVVVDEKWRTLLQSLQQVIEADGSAMNLLTMIDEIQERVLFDDSELAMVIFLGSEPDARQFNRRLSVRAGALLSPIVESDARNAAFLRSSDFFLRLVCERVKTINVTAIGGNTALMEQGASSN